jgi:hypothetical protein
MLHTVDVACLSQLPPPVHKLLCLSAFKPLTQRAGPAMEHCAIVSVCLHTANATSGACDGAPCSTCQAARSPLPCVNGDNRASRASEAESAELRQKLQKLKAAYEEKRREAALHQVASSAILFQLHKERVRGIGAH